VSITFADLPLRPETQAALAEHGFKSPFPIQEMVLPIALGDGDVIGQAKTGTGKTAAPDFTHRSAGNFFTFVIK
jgi:superfamily II DNA/RNA helicase